MGREMGWPEKEGGDSVNSTNYEERDRSAKEVIGPWTAKVTGNEHDVRNSEEQSMEDFLNENSIEIDKSQDIEPPSTPMPEQDEPLP